MTQQVMLKSLKDQVMLEIEDLKPLKNGSGEGPMSPMSRSLWKEKTGADLVEDVHARLTWEDLTVTITGRGGGAQKVLQGLTGYAEPATLTAMMGPSGSGKSTMLDALSGRLAANAFLSGTILLNGHKIKLSFGAAVSILRLKSSHLLCFVCLCLLCSYCVFSCSVFMFALHIVIIIIGHSQHFRVSFINPAYMVSQRSVVILRTKRSLLTALIQVF